MLQRRLCTQLTVKTLRCSILENLCTSFSSRHWACQKRLATQGLAVGIDEANVAIEIAKIVTVYQDLCQRIEDVAGHNQAVIGFGTLRHRAKRDLRYVQSLSALNSDEGVLRVATNNANGMNAELDVVSVKVLQAPSAASAANTTARKEAFLTCVSCEGRPRAHQAS